MAGYRQIVTDGGGVLSHTSLEKKFIKKIYKKNTTLSYRLFIKPPIFFIIKIIIKIIIKPYQSFIKIIKNLFNKFLNETFFNKKLIIFFNKASKNYL